MRRSLASGLCLGVGMALALSLAAQAQGAGVVDVTLNGADIRTATSTPAALAVDAAQPAQLVARITAPPDASWDVRSIRVTLVAATFLGRDGPGVSRELPVDSLVAPGETLVVEHEVDLSALRTVGAGVYRMEVDVVGADGVVLSSIPFFARVAGNPLLTVAGGIAVAASAVAAYGLWQLLRDLRELHAAWLRHRRREGGEGRLATVAGAAIDLTGGVEGVLAVVEGADADAERLARRRTIKWTLTGLGLGSVAVSWAQALGWIPIDLGALLLAATGGALAMLLLSLLGAAWSRRLRARRRYPAKG